MNNVDVVQFKHRLDALFQKTKHLSDNEEIRSHWARYLCVLVSGFIEQSVRLILSDYASKHADQRIQQYIVSNLKWLQNPKMGKILDLLGHFDQTWRNDFETQTAGELGDAITSVVSVRNEIAHGKPTSISLVTISDYYKRVVRAIEFLETIIQK